jgi:hypothetical protein
MISLAFVCMSFSCSWVSNTFQDILIIIMFQLVEFLLQENTNITKLLHQIISKDLTHTIKWGMPQCWYLCVLPGLFHAYNNFSSWYIINKCVALTTMTFYSVYPFPTQQASKVLQKMIVAMMPPTNHHRAIG